MFKSKLVRWAAVALIAICLGVGCFALLLVVVARDPGDVIWSADSGEPVPSTFMYVQFPTESSVSYSDASMSSDRASWKRPLLNEFAELSQSSVGAWDVASSQRRFVDPKTMTYLPADPASVNTQLRAVVDAIGNRTDAPRIQTLHFSVDRDAGEVVVTLRVGYERRRNTFEYSITDQTITPRRWLMKSFP